MKHAKQLNNSLWHLSNQVFNCADDEKVTLKYRHIEYQTNPIMKYAPSGRASACTAKIMTGYKNEYSISEVANKINQFEKNPG